jgi:L-alanine-DL-glutamate epimerase-like enolase superfamily enzyme
VRRRDLITAGLALAFSPAFARAQVGARAKVIDVRIRQIRLVRELGQLDNTDFMAGMRPRYRVGGQSITEVLTDQGVTGIGPGIDPASLEAVKSALVGQDPFRIDSYLPRLYSRGGRGAPNVEIAIWDLMGKLANQPLYALWGGAKDRVNVYASFMTTGSPEEPKASPA